MSIKSLLFVKINHTIICAYFCISVIPPVAVPFPFRVPFLRILEVHSLSAPL